MDHAKHPGFKEVRASLASSSRRASPAAKRKNPRLNRVKSYRVKPSQLKKG